MHKFNLNFRLLIILQLLCLSAFGQINKFGIPFITNYNSTDYSASTQNWSTIEDNRGIMYFGNNDCILEYDGKTWNKIYTSTNSSILSFCIDNNGTIFTGGIDEFGYIAPDKNGSLKYFSLSDKIDSTLLIGEVWKTYFYNDIIYFSSNQNLFKYNYSSIEVVGNTSSKKGNLYHFLIDDKVFLGNQNEGLLILKDTFTSFKDSKLFANDYITSIINFDNDKKLVSCFLNGIFLFSFTNGLDSVFNYPNETKIRFQKDYITNTLKIKNTIFAFSTLQNGIIITDNSFNIISEINKSVKLQDNTIYQSYISNVNPNSSPLWTSLNDGISKIEINSAFKKFDMYQGIEGSIYDIIRYKDTLFVSTNLGVYYNDYKKDTIFQKIKNLPNDSRFLYNYKDVDNSVLIICNSLGLFEFKNLTTNKKLSNVQSFFTTKKGNELYIGNSLGFSVYKRSNNEWIKERQSDFGKSILNIQFDKFSNLWLGTIYDGIIEITNSNDTIYYKEESGLPSIKDIQIYNIHDNLIFATQKGLYSFNYETEKFEKFNKFGENYCDGSCGIYLMAEDSNSVWINSFNDNKEWIERVYKTEDGKYERDTIAFKRLEIKSLQAIYPDKDGIVWFGTADGLYSYDKNFKRDYYQKYYTLIRKITLGEDSVVFNGNYYKEVNNEIGYVVSFEQPKELVFEFPYSQNSITFEYAAPFFEAEEKTEFSVYLDGFDKKWSNWKTESKSIYTNLREGDYIFKVKAKNIYGVESEIAEFKFSISPPWYRTIIAYILYLFITIAIVVIIIKLYTRQLIKDKQRLEKIVEERTAEIRNKNEILEFQKSELQQRNEEILAQRDEIEAQKDEIENQHKIVVEQKDKIEKQNHDIKDSIHYASRIQNALVPPTEFALNYVSEIFILWRPRDIVSGDFHWIKEKNQHLFLIVADCTGHGVPGAFMSMLGISLLNEIVSKSVEIRSDLILNELRNQIILSLHQTGEIGGNQDGMDLTMVIINKTEHTAQFSGANNPLILVRKADGDFSEFVNEEDYKFLEDTNTNTKLVEFKADKMPIGISRKADIPFSSFTFKTYTGDSIYLLTDGYPDQFGGPTGKKFMIKSLKELFAEIYNQNLAQQRETLNNKMEEWLAFPKKSGGKQDQIDDILIIGVKI